MDSVQQNRFQSPWLSTKLNVSFSNDDVSDSFKMNIRMKQDSVIWISTTYYAVEVARFLFTPDSLKFMDKKGNEYYIGTYDFLAKKFQLELSFESIQALILANDPGIEISEDAEKEKTSFDKGQYYVSSFKKRQLKKAMGQTTGNRHSVDEMVYSIWVDPGDFRLSKIAVTDFKTNRFMQTEYSDFKEIGSKGLPHKANIIMQNAGKKTEVEVTYLKVQQPDKPLKFPFNIPVKFKQIEPFVSPPAEEAPQQ